MHYPQLIYLISEQQHRHLNVSQIGQIVDFLYQLDYFNNAANNFGREYLVMLVEYNMIETYVLRKNKPLIDSKHLYILVEGKINKNGFSTGAQILVERDGNIQTLMDCMFLRISLSVRSANIAKIKQFQQNKLLKLTMIQTRAAYDEQQQILMQKLKQIQIFNQLTRADFKQFVKECTLKNILKGKTSHQYGKKIQELIYIVEGEVKIFAPFYVQQNSQNVDSFLEKYLIKPSKNTKHEITANYQKHEWIGMEEHFQKIPSKSFGIIMSVEAKLLYVPAYIFDKIFNLKTNYRAFIKIRHLPKIKAEMFDKSEKVQKKKQTELLRWSQQKSNLSPQLKKKLNKYQMDQDSEKVRNPQIQIQKSKKKQSSPIPTKVVHIVKSKKSQISSEKPILINQTRKLSEEYKLSQAERINLFPQEYASEFIYPQEMREIKDAESNKNTDMMMYLSSKYHRKACKNRNNFNSSTFNLQKNTSLEKSLFTITRKVTDNFALCSTFYRNNIEKGNSNINLNNKTLKSLEPSRKDLLLQRRKHWSEIEQKSTTSFILPGLHTRPTLNDFQPMNPSKGSHLNLIQHLKKHKYHIDSKNSLNLGTKESYQAIPLLKSNKTVNLREYIKTLFVNTQKLEKQKRLLKKNKQKILQKKILKKQAYTLSIL